MTTQIQFNAFNFKSSQVRVITDPNQEFWFGTKDVCDILGYVNDSDAIKKHFGIGVYGGLFAGRKFRKMKEEIQ